MQNRSKSTSQFSAVTLVSDVSFVLLNSEPDNIDLTLQTPEWTHVIHGDLQALSTNNN